METKKIHGRASVIIAVLVIVLGFIGFARRCSSDSESVAMQYSRPQGDTIAVAIEMSPLTYTLHNDSAEGFDYSILKDIAAEHGLTVVFYPVTQLEKAFEKLDRHEYDILVASLPSTKTLKKYFPLTDAVYLDKQVLVQRRDSVGGRGPVLSQEQLMGDTVLIAEGSPFGTRLRNMTKELGDSIFVVSDPQYSSEHLAILTALGEVRQAVVSEAVARHIADKYPMLDIETPISFTQFQCWAVAPGDSALLDSLDVWLKDFKNTPRYRELSDRYL